MSLPGEDALDLCDDMAGELNLEMFQIFPERFETNVGNYIVMNEVMYVGPNSFPDYDKPRHVQHGDIAEGVLAKEGRLAKMMELYYAKPDDNISLMHVLGVTDGGLIIFVEEDGVKSVELGGNSGTFFDIADETSRIMSAGIAKRVLGSEVNVVLLS